MRIINYLFILFFFISISVYSQESQEFDHDLEFAHHLIGLKTYEDAFAYLQKKQNYYLNQEQTDSINFLLGYIKYLEKEIDTSIFYFDKISNLKLKNISNLYSSFLRNNLQRYNEAIQDLRQIEANEDSLMIRVRNIQLAGSFLLKRDFESFDSVATFFSNQDYRVSDIQGHMLSNKEKLTSFKRKSPVLAGLMSAVIPGSGKIYLNKSGQGISTLLLNALFALQTHEAYRKDDINSPRFIIFAGIFSTFYIANIWGTVLSANVRRHEFYETVDNQIMLNLHIPIRSHYQK